jgi:hypothetical protein
MTNRMGVQLRWNVCDNLSPLAESGTRNMDQWINYRTTVFVVDNEAWGPLDQSGGRLANFAVITAWNPEGQIQSRDTNDRLDQQLTRKLESIASAKVRADGCSPDLKHREPGWAVGIPREQAVEIGREFGQIAVFWVENDTLFLLPCIDKSHPEEPVGSWDSACRRSVGL